MRHTRYHFTLVELLTVILIIVVLISLLLPALARSREQAKRAACVSNLHQVGSALMMYALKNKQAMPGGNATLHPGWGIDSSYAVRGDHPMGLAFLLTEEIVTEPQIFYCPSSKHPWNRYDEVDVAGKDPWFGASDMGGWPAPGKEGPRAHRGFSFHYRSSFGDTYNRAPTLRIQAPDTRALTADHFVRREVVYGYEYGHTWGYNVLYLDNHVDWVADPNLYLVSSQPVQNNGNWRYQEDTIWRPFFDQ